MTEDKQLAHLLGRLPVGELPIDVFLGIARLMVVPVVELVVFRKQDEKVQVLLLRRPGDDPLWPNQLHSAGSVVRAIDTGANFSDAIKRIVDGELEGTRITPPQFSEVFLNETKRGKECAQVYFAESTSEPEAGQFYDVDNLPHDVMESQVEFIKRAARIYGETK